MVDKKKNKKLPKCGVNEGDIKPKYGYVFGEADACGGGHLRYRNPKEHEKTWEQHVKPSGQYQTTQHDKEDNELTTQLYPGHHMKYVGKGHSLQVDGNHDVNGELTGSQQYGGDTQYQRKGDHYQGTGGKVMKGSAGGVFEIYTGKTAGGDSGGGQGVGFSLFGAGEESSGGGDQGKTKYNKSVNGDTVVKNKGNHHSSREGDEVKSIKGTKIQMIKEGDYATNVQGGNWDTDVSKKARMKTGDDCSILVGSSQLLAMLAPDHLGAGGGNFTTVSQAKTSVSSGDDMSLKSDAETTIEAKSKITIKVGGSSITIEDGSITIKSSKIKFEEG